jgi:hypothetical protein
MVAGIAAWMSADPNISIYIRLESRGIFLLTALKRNRSVPQLEMFDPP